MKLIILSLALLSTGCSTLHRAADFDRGTREKATTSQAPSGPTLVEVSGYRFFPNVPAMAEECRVALEQKTGKSVNLGDMKIVHDRNIFTGISSCKASL